MSFCHAYITTSISYNISYATVLPKMKTHNNAENRAPGERDWFHQGWICGSPDARCQYCGRLMVFAPACCLWGEPCSCGTALANRSSTRFRPAARIGTKTKVGKLTN